MKSEYVFIHWNTPKMDESKLPEIEKSILTLIPDFDLARLK